RFVLNAESVTGKGGAGLRQGRDFAFNTVPLPFVRDTSPRNGEANVSPGYRRVHISFGTHMNPGGLYGRYEVSPAPDNVVPVVYSNQSLSLEFEFSENTQYTVTLKAGTEDIYGNAIANDYVFSFSVGAVQPSFYLQEDRQFVTTGAYREN